MFDEVHMFDDDHMFNHDHAFENIVESNEDEWSNETQNDLTQKSNTLIRNEILQCDIERRFNWNLIRDFVERFENIQKIEELIDYYDSINRLNDESFAWKAKIAFDSNFMKLSFMNDTQLTKSKNMKKWLNNVDYQRDDMNETLILLNIENFEIFKMSKMSKFVKLKFFQFVTIKTFIDFSRNISLRKKVFVDVIDLKKIYVVIFFILWINFTCFWRLMNVNVFIKKYNNWKIMRNTFRNSQQRFLINSRSILIVVFFMLIQQWCDEIRIIVSDLIVIKYFDVESKNDDNFRHDFKLYDKSFDIARNLNDNVRIVIMISYHIWAIRHEFAAQTAWNRFKRKWFQKNVDAQYYKYDFDFSQKMRNVFENVFLKEVHLIKNIDININVNIKWLNAFFNVCIIATFLWSTFWNFKEILSMIKNSNFWFNEQFHEWMLNDDVNSFENFVNFHFDEMLKCTIKTFERFVKLNDVDDETKKIRMRQIWTNCLIKRTYVSKLSLKTNFLITKNILIIVANIISINFTSKKQIIHDVFTKFLYAKLNKKLNDDKVVWNMKIVRKFILYFIWLDFKHLKKIIKHESFFQWMNDFNCLWKWFLICHNKNFEHYDVSFAKTNHAQILKRYFHEIFKIRAFCQIVVDVVLKRQKKIYDVMTYSTQQILFYKILVLLDIFATSISIHNDESKFRRNYLFFIFVKHSNAIQVFIKTYVKKSIDFNLQTFCNHVLLFDFFSIDLIENQIIERLRRIEQFRSIKVFQLTVFNIFNDMIIWKTIQRALSKMLIQLNIFVFQQRNEFIDLNQLKFWVLIDESKLIHNTNAFVLNLRKLFVKKLIKIIQTKRKNAIIDV